MYYSTINGNIELIEAGICSAQRITINDVTFLTNPAIPNQEMSQLKQKYLLLLPPISPSFLFSTYALATINPINIKYNYLLSVKVLP